MEELSLKDLLKMLKKYGKIIILFTLGCTVVITAATIFLITPKYSSSTQILVNRSREGEIIQGSDIDTNVRLISTYKDIIKSPMILDEVREELGTDLTHSEISGKIALSNEENSQVFTLEVTDNSHQQAAVIANTISKTFQENVGEMMNIDNVTIISSAIANPVPISPNSELSIIIGLVIGLGTGIGVAFLLYFMDNTVKEEKFISDKLQWTILGRIEEVPAKELALLDYENTKEDLTESPAIRSRV